MTSKLGRLRSALEHLLGRSAAAQKAARAASREARAQDRALKDQRRQTKQALRQARVEGHQLRALGLATNDASIVTLDYEKADIRLVATSEMERKWRARSCAKEPWTVAWLEESLADGGVLYDIGANVGTFALVAAKICGARGTVVAFEPGYASFAHLCDNIVLNGCQDIVIPVPFALGRKTSLRTFRYKTLHPGQSRHSFQERRWNPATASHATRYHQPVFAMTLDNVIRQFRLPLPNHIKLDVDGGELNVLRGATRTLATRELQSILIEVDESLTEQVKTFLADAGFMLAEKNKRVHHQQTQVWYGVFRRPA